MGDSQFRPDYSASTSFRDPGGRLLSIDGRILRVVNRTGLKDLSAFLDSRASGQFVERGQLVRTDVLDSSAARRLGEEVAFGKLFDKPAGSIVLEHERLPFQNYPYEWSPEMLHSAARLTLDFAERLLEEGLGLKDATPYNIVFRGRHPIFVDILSFEQRSPGDPIWLPQAQFERTFLLPLLVNKYFGIQLNQLGVRRDGLEPEDVRRLCGPLRSVLPPFWSLVSMPAWLGARHDQDSQAIYQRKTLKNLEKARFILGASFRRLRRLLDKLEPKTGRHSKWSAYTIANNNYSKAHLKLKTCFIEDAMAEFKPKRVLDIGCNTGHYSAIAAGKGARVVAIDSDAVVVGETWRRACAKDLDILPLVVDLTRPSPAIGWRNGECAAFLDRARGAFDAVLMLAVIHHMLVSERIPLEEIVDLAAELTTGILLVEFIAPDDSMFRRLTRGRDHLFAGLTRVLFEETFARRFDLIRSQHVADTGRWLFLMRKKTERSA